MLGLALSDHRLHFVRVMCGHRGFIQKRHRWSVEGEQPRSWFSRRQFQHYQHRDQPQGSMITRSSSVDIRSIRRHPTKRPQARAHSIQLHWLRCCIASVRLTHFQKRRCMTVPRMDVAGLHSAVCASGGRNPKEGPSQHSRLNSLLGVNRRADHKTHANHPESLGHPEDCRECSA